MMPFAVGSLDGVVSTTSKLDRESVADWDVVIQVTDLAEPAIDRQAQTVTMHVDVADSNDNAPVFINTPYAPEFDRDIPVGTLILTIASTDEDIGINKPVRYVVSAFPTDTQSRFHLDPISGELRTTASLCDLAGGSTTQYKFGITATDTGLVSQTSAVDVDLTINDVNHFDPVFGQPAGYEGAVSEHDVSGTWVAQLTATDQDAACKARAISFSIISGDPAGMFNINAATGLVKIAADRVIQLNPRRYEMIVQA
jgi:hypothetical protein